MTLPQSTNLSPEESTPETTTETPETDAQIGQEPIDDAVSADFARTLERQRNAAIAILERANEGLATALTQRDAARAELERVKADMVRIRQFTEKHSCPCCEEIYHLANIADCERIETSIEAVAQLRADLAAAREENAKGRAWNRLLELELANLRSIHG